MARFQKLFVLDFFLASIELSSEQESFLALLPFTAASAALPFILAGFPFAITFSGQIDDEI